MYNYTVYAYWNQDQLFNLFNAVVIIMGGGDWLLLMKSIAIVGLIAAAGGALARGRGENFATYFIFTAIMYGAVMLPKTDVVIEDVTGHNAPMVVSNVPWGVGALSSITSHIGYWLTKGYETALAIPGDIAFQKNGFLFGAKLLTAKQNTTIRDPQLRTDMLNWYQECIAYEIAGDPVMQDVIKNSNDIWTDSSAIMNQGRVVSIYHAGTGQTSAVNCKTAYDELGPRLTADKNNNVIPMLGAYLFANDPVATAGTQTSMDVAELTMLNVAATGADTIKQAMLLNLFREGPANIAAVTNNPAMAAIEMAKVQAAAQANAGYETGRALSESALPLIRNAIHTLIIGVFPIVLLLILVSGDKGITILASYVSMLVFVELWAPLFAIVNHLLTYASMKDTASIVQNTGGVTLETYDMVSKGLITAQGVAGMLTLSIPVMAYMIVSKSQNAAANIASGVMQPSQSASQSAGSNAAMGNLSGGNVQWTNSSMHNGTMNQWNDAPTAKTGAGVMTKTGSDGSSITTMEDGSQVLDRSATQSNLGAWTMGLSSTASTQNQEASKNSYQSSETAAITSAKSMGAALSAFKSHENDFSKNNGVNVATGSGSGVNISKALDNINSASNEVTKGQNFTKEELAAITATAAAEVGGSFGVANIRAGLQAQGVSNERLSSAVAATQKLGGSDSFKTGVSQLDDVSQKISATNGSGHQEAWAEGIKKDFTQSKTSARTSQEQLSKAEEYAETASKIGKGDASVGKNLAQAWVNSHGGPEGANSYINSHSEAEISQDMRNFTLSEAAKEAIHDSNFADQSGGNKNLVAATSSLTPPTNRAELTAQGNANDADVRKVDKANAKEVPTGANQSPTATATTPIGNKGQGGHVDGTSYTVTPASVTDEFKSEGRNAYLPAEATRIAGEVASGDDSVHDKLLDKGQSGALMSGVAGVSKSETPTPKAPASIDGWDTLQENIKNNAKDKGE